MTLAGQVGKYFRVHVDSVYVSRRDAIWQESRTQVAFGIRMALQETVMFIQKVPGENPGFSFNCSEFVCRYGQVCKHSMDRFNNLCKTIKGCPDFFMELTYSAKLWHNVSK